MSNDWIDDASRRLAQAQSRRQLILRFFGVVLGSLALASSRRRQALAQTECSYGEVACGGYGGDFTCIDVSYDDDNCGYCGNGCPRGSSCLGGQCEGEFDDYRDTDDCYTGTFCDDGFGGYVCVELEWDSYNCGSCGAVCPTGSSCVSGECLCNIGDFCFTGNVAQCVDTEWDRLNCGSCGNVCDNGTNCIAGRCSQSEPIATQKPSNVSSSVPFGLDAVTDDALTESRFAALLPSSFSSYELITNTTVEDASEPLYAGVIRSKTFFYRNTEASSSTVMTLANVAVLREDRPVDDMLFSEQRACRESPECSFIGQNLSPGSRVAFQYQTFPFGDIDAFVSFLAWGQPDGLLMFTFMASSRATLESLATTFVKNAKESSASRGSRRTQATPSSSSLRRRFVPRGGEDVAHSVVDVLVDQQPHPNHRRGSDVGGR